jgi:hypothetical protein
VFNHTKPLVRLHGRDAAYRVPPRLDPHPTVSNLRWICSSWWRRVRRSARPRLGLVVWRASMSQIGAGSVSWFVFGCFEFVAFIAPAFGAPLEPRPASRALKRFAPRCRRSAQWSDEERKGASQTDRGDGCVKSL